jgi:hypothetical protein
MKSSLLKLGLVALSLTSALSVIAEDSGKWGRFDLSYRAGLNISANFSGLGGFAPTGNPGPLGAISAPPGTIVRTYDDGFIGIDISGNAGNMTTFWGYNNASQVSGDSLLMHSSSSSATTSSGNVDGDPQHGFELSYALPLGGGKRWSWGLEGAFNWTDINIKDSRPLSGNVFTLAHAFSRNGVPANLAPPAPYTGPFNGPGQFLGDVATAAPGLTTVGGASIVGNRKIDAALYGFRVGPRVELTVCKRCSLELGAGLSFGVIDSEFSFNETVTITGLGTRTRSGKDRSSAALFGPYIRGQINVQLWKSLSWFGGVEFNDLGTFDQTVAGKKAQLDLGAAVYLSTGLGCTF